MQRFFIWLSGADTKLLEQCTRLPNSEKRKFAGFGTTVLIPATLGLFSMGYALSTFSTNPRVYITGGITWFLMVLAIDRFLVSTLYKSSVKSNRDFWLAFIFRLLFAGFVGIAVSHPLILFLFEGSIHQKIEDTRRAAVESRLTQIQALKNSAQKGEAGQMLEKKTKLRKCLDALLTAEQSGTQKEVKDEDGVTCGYSSDIKECGFRCRNILDRIRVIDAEVIALQKQIDADVGSVETTTQNDLKDIEGKFSEDYPARVKALASIEKDEPHIRTARIFLLAFFVFVDTLLVLLKGTTPKGEYEEIRDSLLFEVEVTEKAKREAVGAYATTAYRATVEAERRYDGKKDEIITLIRVTNHFIGEQERQREIFDEHLKGVVQDVRTVKDAEVRNAQLGRLVVLRNTFNIAWSKAVTRFQEYLKGL